MRMPARLSRVLERLGQPAELAVVTLLLVLAGLATAWLRHGMTVTWRLGGGSETVARTTEYRVEIKTSMRPLSRYVQAWDFKRHGVPSAPPSLDAMVEAELTVPAGPPVEVGVESVNAARLLADGSPLTGPLAPGRHVLQATWTGTLTGNVTFHFVWNAGGARVPVPRSALRPAGGAPVFPQLVPWLMAVVLGTGFVAYRRWRVPPPRRRTWIAVGVAAIVLAGAGLRLFDYQVAPDMRENDDELFATWNGWELLHSGRTRGWSLWPDRRPGQAKIEHLDYFGKKTYEIVQPYFEHPPLLHLMVGTAATVGGATHWTHARLQHTRLVPVVLSLCSLLLLMLLALELLPATRAWLFAGLLHAFLPIAVLQERVIKEEALLTPLVLASILGLLRWRRSRTEACPQGSMRALTLAAVAAALCPLAKLPGAACTVAFLLLLTAERHRGALVRASLVAAGGLALLLLYAAVEGWNQFWYTTAMQGTRRPTHFNIFTRFFDVTLVNHNNFGRGWILGLWASFLLGLRQLGDRARFVAVPLVFWLLAIGVSSGNWTFGWYNVPVYPWLCLGAGALIAELWDQPESGTTMLAGFVLVCTLAFYSLNFVTMPAWGMNRGNWPTMRLMVTAALALGIAPFVAAELLKGRWRRLAARTGIGLTMATFTALGAWFVVLYDVMYDAFKNFDRAADFFK